jgi:neutral ceramidase
MTNRNTLVSGDNKGYAAYYWERLVHGVDYLGDECPDFVSAFAQTNTGDMSPNLWRGPGRGPTEDEFENTRIIGRRQAEAAASLAAGNDGSLEGGVDARCRFVDMTAMEVKPEFTGDGRVHLTGAPAGGAAALAGTDEGPGFPGFRQGHNPVWDRLSSLAYRLSPRLRDAQAPKGMVLAGPRLNRLTALVQERVPVQLLRIGKLYLIGMPAEVTIVAGLRMRRAVASVVGAELRDVLVAGYCNAYVHYVTTPEEYDAQRYEGGSTLFGRWEAPAFTQVAVELATAMRDGRSVDPGAPPADPKTGRRRRRRPGAERPLGGFSFGDVVVAPNARYRLGEQVHVTFAGADPNNDLHRGHTYLEVEQELAGTWHRIADDGDWETKVRFTREDQAFGATVTWDVPPDASGTYRIRYFGDARSPDLSVTEFSGTTAPFVVQGEPSAAG